PAVDVPGTSLTPAAFAPAVSAVKNARIAACPFAAGACGGISTASSVYSATIFSTSPALYASSHVTVAALSAASSAAVSAAGGAAGAHASIAPTARTTSFGTRIDSLLGKCRSVTLTAGRSYSRNTLAPASGELRQPVDEQREPGGDRDVLLAVHGKRRR